MSNFRLNAKKPHKNAGLPTPKSEMYLLYVEDIISMPQSNAKGIVTEGNIMIADGRRFHILYLTPSTQTHNRDTEGDVDSRGWKKKIVGHYPGDEIEINEFLKNNTNQGFVIIVKSCGSSYKKIYGSKCNPLFFTGAFVDDSDKKGYDLTFEQEFADADPVLFYDGNILVDEDALDPNDPEFSTLFVKIDGSNISGANKEKLKQALDIGELPSNIALVDEGDDEGNTYTKLQVDDKFLKKTTTAIATPTSEFKYIYLTNEQNETRRMPVGNIGSNIANATLTTTEDAGIIQAHNYDWQLGNNVFTMYRGEKLGLTYEDLSMSVGGGFSVLQGTGDNNEGYGRTGLEVTSLSTKLTFSQNQDEDDEINSAVEVSKYGVSIDGFVDADNDDTFDRQVVTKPNGILATKSITPDILDTVAARDNYTSVPLKFYKGDGTNTKDILLGVYPDNTNLFFGSMPTTSGSFNIGMGYGALQKNFTGVQNTAIGAYALSKNMSGNYNLAIGTSSLQNLENDDTTDDEYKNNNVAIGVHSGYSLLKSGRNTLLGKDTAKNVKTLFCSTFIGYGSGYALNYTGSEDRTTVGFIKSKSPVLGNSWYMGKNVGGLQYFGIDPNTSETDYSTSMGMNTLVGSNIADSTTAPRRMYASTVIGVNPLWNCTTNFFNNLLIGAGNYFKYTGQEINNSIIIGNFNYLLNADNILCIHNSVNTQEDITDGLIYGSFKERWLKINGQLKLDLNRTYDAEGDGMFQKMLTVKPDGTVGVKDIEDFSSLSRSISLLWMEINNLKNRVQQLENNNP
ncbi:hypothetical protein [Riemerella columbina]|uniref:hypothetical protein n=1 Tax=Riemerella columbina TaxID=103810 RepID=UPI0003668831|nr:hypothetical protein [Riemerella columbina]